MQEIFFHILSKVPSEIRVMGTSIGLIDNLSNFELDFISKTDKVFINFTPISYNKNSMPYTVQINTMPVVSCENNNVEIIPYPNNHYDVIFSPFEYNNSTTFKTLLIKNFSKYSLTIVSGVTTQVNIYSGSNILKTFEIPYISTAKATEKNDVIIIEGIIDKDNYYLLVIDASTLNVIYNDTVQSIELTENEISSYKNIEDISNHAEIFKMILDKKTIEKYYVYKNNVCNNAKNMLLIPEDFLECLKVNDETKCRMLLSNNLSSTPLEKFKSFFGDIKNIYLNRHENSYEKINYTIKSNTLKNYNFVMQNNQIKDIEEVF